MRSGCETGVDEQYQVNQVFDPGVWALSVVAGEGVQLLGEVLLGGDRLDCAAWDPGELQRAWKFHRLRHEQFGTARRDIQTNCCKELAGEP